MTSGIALPIVFVRVFFFGFSLSYESFKTKATDVRPATSKIGDVGR